MWLQVTSIILSRTENIFGLILDHTRKQEQIIRIERNVFRFSWARQLFPWLTAIEWDGKMLNI